MLNPVLGTVIAVIEIVAVLTMIATWQDRGKASELASTYNER